MISEIIVQRLLSASIETACAGALVLLVATWMIRRSPRAAAVLWLVVLLKPLLTLAGGAIVGLPIPASMTAPLRRAGSSVELTRVVRGSPESSSSETTQERRPAQTIVWAWLAGLAMVLGRTVRDRMRLRRIVACSHPPSGELADAYARLTRGISSAPELVVCDALEGPAIAGVVRPFILVPSWMEVRAGGTQIDWILRHELRHAAARDTIGIAVREIALAAFWFHPVVWLAARKWEAATELACDRDVVGSDAEAVDYADVLYGILLNVRQRQRVRMATGLFATRSSIGTRIAALVEEPLRRQSRGAPVIAAVLAVALVTLGGEAADRKHHKGRFEEVNDDRSMLMDWDGVFEFSGPDADVERLSAGGWIDFRETVSGRTRSLHIAGTGAGPRRAWTINGREVQPDEEMRVFEKQMTSRMRKAMGK